MKFGSKTTFYTVGQSGFSFSKIIIENIINSNLLSLVFRNVLIVDIADESKFWTYSSASIKAGKALSSCSYVYFAKISIYSFSFKI